MPPVEMAGGLGDPALLACLAGNERPMLPDDKAETRKEGTFW